MPDSGERSTSCLQYNTVMQNNELQGLYHYLYKLLTIWNKQVINTYNIGVNITQGNIFIESRTKSLQRTVVRIQYEHPISTWTAQKKTLKPSFVKRWTVAVNIETG